MSGFELELVLERFTLQPAPSDDVAAANRPARAVKRASGFAQGHAHLAVNGHTVARIHERTVHLPGRLFRRGVNQITVTLDDDSRATWTRDDRVVLATLFIDPDRAAVEVHRFESFPTSKGPH